MTRWGFCEGLGAYDIFEQLSVEVFYESLWKAVYSKKRGPYINCDM